jgi:signal transduction histidine kinase
MRGSSEQSSIRRLLDVGRALTTELDQGVVLERVLEAAREITGARYAALGVLNEDGTGLARFLTSGVDEATREQIGAPPSGRGVLGELIAHPHPLRLADVGSHPSSYGMPAGHPPMHSFLGVPVVIRGRVWGNLYLAEKESGEFTADDEQAAVILAEWAAIAIGNAKLYESSERRREELEKAVRGLEATRDVAAAIGREIELERVLELIVKRGRALAGARSLVIMLREGEDLVVHASAGHAGDVHGARLPIAESTSGQVLERGQPERITDAASRLRIAADRLGVPDAHTALLVPMMYRNEALGILAAFDHGPDAGAFGEEDEQSLRTFAASAATAVALAQSVQSDRLRSSLAAADAERGRWARELHDETLQGLGGLRLMLSAALRQEDPEKARAAVSGAVEEIEREIANLRAIITELRPAALDELGLRAAIEALLDRHREQNGCRVEGELSLPEGATGEELLSPELQTTVYRVVQEALTNVAKHARAESVRVSVVESDGKLRIEVCDDGCGFDADQPRGGFGIAGMSERASLAGGELSVSSNAGGTRVCATLPLDGRAASASHPQQAAS